MLRLTSTLFCVFGNEFAFCKDAASVSLVLYVLYRTTPLKNTEHMKIVAPSVARPLIKMGEAPFSDALKPITVPSSTGHTNSSHLLHWSRRGGGGLQIERVS